MKLRAVLTFLVLTTSLHSAPTALKFDFGTNTPRIGFTQIDSTTPSPSLEFLYLGEASTTQNALSFKDYAIFACPLPEGNYRVTLHFLSAKDSSPITIKAESRRLYHQSIPQSDTGTFNYTFTVNTRTAQLKDGGNVKLKDREIGTWLWDDKLQIEIDSPSALLDAIEISPILEIPTLYLIGDSTVTDQTEEPWTGWGQMLPRFFAKDIAISNHAASGLAFSSFKSMRRFDKILDTLKPNDFVLIQFGHNDQKEKGDGIGPWKSYTNSIHEFVATIREKEAHPILVTSMKRRRFDDQGRQFETLGDYPNATRKAAFDLQVPLVELNYMSGVLYAALGPEDSKKAFVHYPANTFPGQDNPLQDDTHFNTYGGYQLAHCVVEALRLAVPELVPYMDPTLPPYDPAYPDPLTSFNIPPSPIASSTKPDGN